MSERASKISRKLPAQRRAGGDSAAQIKAKAGKTGRLKRTSKAGGKTTKMRTGKLGRGKKKDEKELEPITPFKRGLSIGVKFAGLTACVVGLFMGLLGYLTYSIAATQMDNQINEEGVSVVNTLEKAVDRGLWVYRPIPQPPAEDGTDRPEIRVGRDPDVIRTGMLKEWTRRLQGIVEDSGGKIVSVNVFNEEPGGVLSQVVQWPEGQLAFEEGGSVPTAPGLEGIEVVTGRLQSGISARRFGRVIELEQYHRDRDIDPLIEKLRAQEQDGEDTGETLARLQDLSGEESLRTYDEFYNWRLYEVPPIVPYEGVERVTPRVWVFVKASALEELKSSLWQRISLVTACGALAGILLTVLIAAVLTGPIRELEQDIGEVAGGNLGHQSRVRSTDEIGALAHVFNIMTRNLNTAQANAVQREAIERELNIAKEIQEKLLPERIPQIPGLDIHSHYNSAKEVGGDYYDFIVIDQTHLGIIVADVAGKGIPGAMVMTMARSLVRLASVRNISPADTFKKVNRILAKDIRRGMFVTAAYMVLNVKTKVLRIASAGHNPVVLCRAKTGENELLKPSGIALGFDKGTIFDNHIKELEVKLERGDRLVTYTDGVDEAMSPEEEEFGAERFYELCKTHAKKSSKEFVEAVVAALDKHRAGAEQSDDITITTLSVKG